VWRVGSAPGDSKGRPGLKKKKRYTCNCFTNNIIAKGKAQNFAIGLIHNCYESIL